MPSKKSSTKLGKARAKAGKTELARASASFKRGLVARGELVPEKPGMTDRDLPPGVTHVQDSAGKIKRRRFALS